MKYEFKSTPWELVELSEATEKHLKLGTGRVWSRMNDGIIIFIVLHAGLTPGPDNGGFVSLDAAITASRKHQKL
jgi:hypothetical protein